VSQIIYPTPQPYCYHITCIPTRQSYIGVRYANKVSAEQDLLVFYSTSSKPVNLLIEEHGKEAFRIDWIRTYNTKEEAWAEEMILLKEHDVLNNDLYLNAAIWPARNQKGENNGMYGKTHSAETRKKISEAQSKGNWTRHSGKTHSAETKRLMSETRKGRTHSAEARKKMSEAARRRAPDTDETREKKRVSKLGEENPSYGTKHSAESLKKMSDSLKGIPQSAESRKKKSEALKGRVITEETRKKMSKAQKSRKRDPHTPETRKKMSEAQKRYYASRKAAE